LFLQSLPPVRWGLFRRNSDQRHILCGLSAACCDRLHSVPKWISGRKLVGERAVWRPSGQKALRRRTLFPLAILLCCSLSLNARPITWTLNATFDDGGTASGGFTYDADTGTFSNWNVSTAGGNTSVFFPFTFTTSNSTLGFNQNDKSGRQFVFSSNATFPDSLAPNPESLDLGITPVSPMSDAGGTLEISPGATLVFSGECFDCGPARNITVGTLSASQGSEVSQTITFLPLSNVTLGVAPFAISATASSGLAVTFVSFTRSVCTVTGNAVIIVALGTCSITASQAGNGTYAPATPVTQSFMVVSGASIITTVAGDGMQGFSGDGGPATLAEVEIGVSGLVTDGEGNLFIADSNNSIIRKVSPSGIITAFAGIGDHIGYSGDGGPATSATLSGPQGMALDASGNLFIAEATNGVIRKVSPSGIITTVAGIGNHLGFSGDSGPATSAMLNKPYGVAVDASGNVFIADSTNNRIRKVSPSGIISTVAGNGKQSYSGDGGPATSAELNFPTAVAVDISGNLLIADYSNSRIRKVAPNGIITTAAGSGDPGIFFGNAGFSGDGGPATSATISIPGSVAVDSSGNFFIADTYNNRIRKVSASGIISTVAGSGVIIDVLSADNGYNDCCQANLGTGDGGPATSATLDHPFGVAVDASGNIFIADSYDFRVREVLVPTTSSGAPDAPVLNTGGIFNASFNSGALAASPGSLISIFGSNLSTSSIGAVADSHGNLPLTLAGATVHIGSISAPLLYVSPGQINAQVPFELSPRGYAVTVTTAAGLSNSVDLNVTATSPGMFAGAVVSNKNGAQINAGNPMRPGDVIVIYCTGLGAVSPNGVTGQLASANPISSTIALPTVTIGGVPVEVANAVLSPGFVGVYQIGIVAPGGLPSGTQALVVTSGGVMASPLLVISEPSLDPQYCADVSGVWNVTQLGSVTETATSAVENVNVTDPFTEQGSINIVQAGCNISYTPTPVPGLITTDQAASLVRTGTVVGSTVSLQGLLTTQALAVANQPGLTITQVTQNEFRASGQLTGAILTTNDSGQFVGSGTYSANGQSGTFTLNYVTSGATTLLRPGIGPTVTAAPPELNVQTKESAQAQSQSLYIGGTVGIRWQATVSTSDGNDWLTVVPGSGEVPALPTATIAPGSLPVGTYHGSIVIQALGVSPPSIATIDVALTIAGSTAAGTITTVAGVGPACEFVGSHCGGFSGDGGPATAAALNDPVGIAVDAAGNLFIGDTYNDRIRKVSANGSITTIAGSGAPGCPSNMCFSGDGGPATAAQFHSPMGVAVDKSGNLFIADYLNARVRKISADGTITTVAGDATCCGFSGDGGPATSATLWDPTSVAVDAAGNLFIADLTNNRIRKVSTSGIITTVAGSGKQGGFSGDGGPATSALLNNPFGVAVDGAGNIFIADSDNSRIRKVSAGTGIITTVAGNGSATSGEGVPATSVGLGNVNAVTVDSAGNIFFVDGLVIQKVAAATGLITTIAGNGGEGFSGDGGLATSAMLNYPGSIAVDASGNLLIADSENNRIRKVFQAGAPAAAAHSINSASAVRVGVGLTAPAGSAVFGSVAIPLQPIPLPPR